MRYINVEITNSVCRRIDVILHNCIQKYILAEFFYYLNINLSSSALVYTVNTRENKIIHQIILRMFIILFPLIVYFTLIPFQLNKTFINSPFEIDMVCRQEKNHFHCLTVMHMNGQVIFIILIDNKGCKTKFQCNHLYLISLFICCST